jgi:hypothetical protein
MISRNINIKRPFTERDGNRVAPRVLLIFILVFISHLLGACSISSNRDDSTASQPQETIYNHDSWKTMIPDSCLTFFDGCNNCRRSAAGEVAACTRMACIKYKKPRCLDDAK